jgi:hypothetical protein
MELAHSFFTLLGAANRVAMVRFTEDQLETAHQVMNTLTDTMDHFRTELTASPSTSGSSGTEQA